MRDPCKTEKAKYGHQKNDTGKQSRPDVANSSQQWGKMIAQLCTMKSEGKNQSKIHDRDNGTLL